MTTEIKPEQVLNFWFNELEPSQWWVKDPELDRSIGERFGDVLKAAACCELWSWRATPKGRLAEIIVLDQFSRNVYRDTPAAFAQDPLCLALAQETIASGAYDELSTEEQRFVLMPFMHSESARIHVEAERLFKELGQPQTYEYEIRHKVIVERFGRYPHRNEILGRVSTPEEIEFLKGPNSSF